MNENTGPGPTTDKNDPPTIKEIARLAGVSIGTVDRVVHHRGRVSVENVDRINAIIAEKGYTPNVFASRLSRGATTKTIGILMPMESQDFGYWGMIAQGMRKALGELKPLQIGFELQVFDRHSSEACAEGFEQLRASGCQGLAIAPIHNRILKGLVETLPRSWPVVFFDTDMDCAHEHCFVGQDPWQGGNLAGKLLGLGLKSEQALALVEFDEDDHHLQKRSEGLQDFARRAGRPVVILKQRLADPLVLRREQTAEFLTRNPGVGGLFVPNASVAEYASLGKGFPIVGYDLTPDNIASLRAGRIEFLLSQRPELMGYEAIRLLGRALIFQEALPSKVGLPIDVVLKENLEGFLEA